MIKKTTKKLITFYRPIFDNCIGENIGELDFYREYRNAKDDYPKHTIGVYEIEERKTRRIIDDEDYRSKTYYVDIPNSLNEEWINIAYFKTREDAIKYAQETFGADEDGKVSLISVS